MKELSTIIGALLGNVIRAFTLTTGVLLALWVCLGAQRELLSLDPEVVGQWQAKVEFAFLEEADKLGLWGE